MITKRTSLVLALMAGFGIAAAPAHAQETNAAAAVGAIDMSKVTAPAQAGDDAQFQQLFAKWDELDRTTPAAARVSVPSRGMRTHPVLGGRRSHKGVDLSAPTGTPIYATADGYISKAEWFSSYGKYVSIEHGANLQTRFAHMSDIAVTAGSRVKKGDIIGYVGSTGRSTGPHLHYEVRIDGKAVNPVPYMVESEAQRAFALATGQGGQGDGEE